MLHEERWEYRMNFDDWVKEVPKEFRDDPLWKMEVYRIAMFLNDICWHDVSKLAEDQRTTKLSDQLYRAMGSISANIEEGYSQGTSKNRARYYRYALGSARESRGWYYKARFVLGKAVMNHRVLLLTGIIRSLLVIIQNQGDSQLREQMASYIVDEIESELSLENIEIDLLSLHVPF